MAQAIDSSSAPLKSPPSSSEVAPNDDQTAGRCVQDIDPSRACTVSHIGDCNLECCYCALRWTARRILLEGEE
jgi:hypothetical protein